MRPSRASLISRVLYVTALLLFFASLIAVGLRFTEGAIIEPSSHQIETTQQESEYKNV